MTANIRTPQRTVSAMQRFAVSQKNHAEAITISPFLLSLPYRTENRRFSALSCTKNRRHPTEVECRLFCCPILLGRCRFCSFLKLLSYRHTAKAVPFVILRRIIRFPPGSAGPGRRPVQSASAGSPAPCCPAGPPSGAWPDPGPWRPASWPHNRYPGIPPA